MNYSVYMIYFINNKKRYIGISKDVNFRIETHKRAKSENIIHKAIKKHTLNNVRFYILAENIEKNDAIQLEKFYITYYNTLINEQGYNVRTGGNLGNCLTGDHYINWKNNIKKSMNLPEVKSKLSLNKMKEKNPNYNKKLSKSTMDKMKLTRKLKRSSMVPVTMDNFFTFFSITEAALYVTGNTNAAGNIYNACRGKLKTAYQHQWKFIK